MSSINSIVLKNTYSSTQGERASSILWRHAGTSGGITGFQSSIRSKYDTSTSGTNLEFRTYAGGATLNTDTIAMTVQPDGNISIGNLTATTYKLDVNGTSIFRNAITGLSRLDITGDVSLNSKLDTIGSALFRNRLDVTGDVSLNSKLDTTGSALLRNRLDVTGDVSLNSNLETIGNTLLKGTLNVSGASYLASRLDIIGDVSLNSKLETAGSTLLKGTLNVSGASSLASRLDITSDVSLNSKLDTIGSALFRNRLDVTGDVSLNSNTSIASNIYYGGDLYKNGILVNALKDASELQQSININNNIPSTEHIIQVKRHIIPDISNLYSLGSKDRPFRHLYVGPSSLYVNGKQVISDNTSEMLFKTDSGQSLSIQAGGAGQMKISSEQGGVVIQSTSNGSIQIETGTNGGISLSTNNGAMNLTSNTGTYNMSSTSGNVNISTSSGNLNMSTSTGSVNIRGSNIVLDPSSNTGTVTVKKDLYVEGNIYKTGTTLEINVEQLKISDNLITLNSNMTDNIGTLVSGIEVNRGSNLSKYNFFFKEDGDRFVIGMAGEEQAVATRQDNPISNGVAFWNNTLSRFDTSANLTWAYDATATAYKLNVNGIVSSTEDITTSSDVRLKKNIEPLSDMLNLVKQLNPVSYELNYGSGKRNVGFIAQELQQHLPELVTQSATEINGVENPLAVSYQNMVAVLCKAVQELAKRVEELESR